MSDFKFPIKRVSTSDREIVIKRTPGENCDVISVKNGKVRLRDRLAEGGEGYIYETNIGYVAKVYKILTHRTQDKIKRLVEKKFKFNGICFPLDLITYDGILVGYLMSKAKGKSLQSSVFQPKLLKEEFPSWTRRDLVILALTILEKIQFLHQNNIILGDINPNNFFVNSPTDVYFVDTDSYQIYEFPCPVGTDFFTPPELQGENFKTVLRTYENEYFAVAVLLFMLMLPGKSPYAQKGGDSPAKNIKNGEFPYPLKGNSEKVPDGPWLDMWKILPNYIQERFWNTFHKEGKAQRYQSRPSVEDWIEEFKKYKQYLDSHSNTNENSIFPSERSVKGHSLDFITQKYSNESQSEVTTETSAISRKAWNHSWADLSQSEVTTEASAIASGLGRLALFGTAGLAIWSLIKNKK